jgi:N-acetylated-alpha-linked acidic dipeptidase
MRAMRTLPIGAALLAGVFAVSVGGQRRGEMIGFSAENADRTRSFERIMAAVPDAETMGRHHRELTRRPHHAGSEQNYQDALYIRDRLAEFGYETEMFRYDVWIPWPRDNRPMTITLTAPVREEIVTVEPPIPEDPDTFIDDGLPPMAAYVPSGTASGELVYANFGRVEDYRRLEDIGVSLANRIVIVRYGAIMRGMKVREAARRGAAGVILYSDPMEDGYVRGPVYPAGTWRPWTGVERGSMLDVPIYPGDPLTPFRPSIPGVERLAPDEAETIQKIPAHPISYGEALKLLRHLDGPYVPEWQGGLPITYHVGPGPATVTMVVDYDYQQRPVWNVFGSIRGTTEPERIVEAGGHRDAWVLGGRDPTSGAVSLLETARGIAEAVTQGFEPRRTIRFASWGGEEYFLLGSTEHGEQFADELRRNQVVYINRESYTAGGWSFSGNHGLERFMIETSKDAPHPERPTLYDAWVADRGDEPIRLAAPGSGSDFTVFVHHLGVPALSGGFAGPNGVYHSLYDTLVWFQKFGDPGYEYGLAQADMVGRMMMRLAAAEILPWDFTGTADAVGRYVDELPALDRDAKAGEAIRAVAAANARLRAAAVTANRAFEALLARGADWLERERAALHEINGLIMQAERDLLDDRGLPRRPWYRNLLYAPGYYTGYGVKTLPGVREAMEAGEWEEAGEQAGRLRAAIERATATIDQAAARARQSLGQPASSARAR